MKKKMQRKQRISRVVKSGKEEADSSDEEDAATTDFEDYRSGSSVDEDEDSDIPESRTTALREEIKSRGYSRLSGGKSKKKPKVKTPFYA